MPNLPTVNPVQLFGVIPEGHPTYGSVIAKQLGLWEFKLFPQLWKDTALETAKGLAWVKVRFGDDRALVDTVPVDPGVYYFTVEGRTDLFPCHAYIFYVGKAEKGLRSRYEDYIQEREGEEPDMDRENITRFLNYFRGWVHFNYLVMERNAVAAMESALKDNLTPPANTILKLKGRLYPVNTASTDGSRETP